MEITATTESSFEGVDIEERDKEIEEAAVEPLKISVDNFSNLGLLTLSFNR